MIYPLWVNNKLRAWEGLGHPGMFCARLSMDDFCSKLENISFLSRVTYILRSFCFPRFCKIRRQTFERWGVWFRRCFEALFETPLRHRASRCELRLRPRVFFENHLLFLKQSQCYLPYSYGGSQAEQSILVLVRRKLE